MAFLFSFNDYLSSNDYINLGAYNALFAGFECCVDWHFGLPIETICQCRADLNQIGPTIIIQFQCMPESPVVVEGVIDNCTFWDIRSIKFVFNFNCMIDMTEYLYLRIIIKPSDTPIQTQKCHTVT